VNTNNRVVGIGYNAMPRGCDGAFFTSKWKRNEPNKPNKNKEKNEEEPKWIDTKYPYGYHSQLF
jgi:deoxycytidylate deaminase